MPDKLKILPQELRENADPEEAIRPMPWLAAVVAIGMVIFGIVYPVSYTQSDAADDTPCVELGGRRNIQTKNNAS